MIHNDLRDTGNVISKLKNDFQSPYLYSYIPIAVGEAYTAVLGNEDKLGYMMSLSARQSFIYVVARNKLRNEKRRHKNLRNLGDASNHFKNEPALRSERFELDANNKIAVAQIMALLSEKRKEAMTMKYLQGSTEKEIAKELGISIYSVEDRLRVAKKEL